MSLNVNHLLRTLDTLSQALNALDHPGNNSVTADLYRNAAIKSFELSLETIGKLLRKALKAFTGNPREVDRLVFNDIFRQAGKHAMLDMDSVGRWLAYRKNRNSTVHDDNEAFANETLQLLPKYLDDARSLAQEIQKVFDANT